MIRAPSSPILYLHITKTGGTSLIRWLRRCFPDEDRKLNLTPGDQADAIVGRLSKMDREDLSKIGLVFGTDAGRVAQFFPNASVITLVRSSVSRFMSVYTYTRHANDLEGHVDDRTLHGEAPLERVLSDIMESSATKFPFDDSARTLARFARIKDPTIPPTEQLAASDASKILDAFHFVGVTNQLPLFAFLLTEHFSLPPEPIGQYNTTNSADLYLPKWFTDEIEHRSPLDTAIYNLAQARFDEFAQHFFNESAEAYLSYQEYLGAHREKASDYTVTREILDVKLRQMRSLLPRLRQAVEGNEDALRLVGEMEDIEKR